MSKSSKGNGGWLAFTVLLGVVSSVAGLYAFGKDEVLSRFMPEFSSARVIDVTEASEQSVVEITDVIEESVVSKEEIRIVVSEALDEATMLAAKDGRMITGRQSVEYIEAATRLLEQNTKATEKILLGLESSDAKGAAEQLVALAKAQTESVDTPKNVASETWRNAAALLYPISPEEASIAYRKASDLQIDDKRLAKMAASIEAELVERASSNAPDAVLQFEGYSGPIKSFDNPIKKGNLLVTPSSCEAMDMIVECKFLFEYKGEERRITLSGMVLVDDWSRSFAPTLTKLGTASDNDGSVYTKLPSGTHEIVVRFEQVPGGSNYGVQFLLDDYFFVWRGVPTDGLDKSLRMEWGGPIGVASYVPLNETISHEPYAIRQTGCERFGRDLRCFGQVAYAGPKRRLNLSEMRLVDSKGQEYPAVFSLLANVRDNDGSVYTDIKTGDYDYVVRFYGVPLNSEVALAGKLNNETNFQFGKISFGDQSSDIERLNYMYDFPLRLNVGGDVRFRDFKLFPRGCVREAYTAVCELEVLYVGAPKRIYFDQSYLIDSKNNYYSAISSEVLGTNISDNDGSIYGNFGAGRFVLRQKFDSLPPGRLFEQTVRIDQSASLFVSNLTLTNAEGRMGIPTDIVYTEFKEEKKFGESQLKTNGCVRRGLGVECFLELRFVGPKSRKRIDSLVLSDGTENITASAVSLGGNFDNDSSVYGDYYQGTYPIVASFKDVPKDPAYTLSLRLDKEHLYRWSSAHIIP